MMRLDDTQRVLWQLITTPEGGSAGVAAQSPARACGLGGLVHRDEGLHAAGRADVYANMYRARLLECLSEDFPALHTVGGHEDFRAVAGDYLVAHPATHPSVRRLGEAL